MSVQTYARINVHSGVESASPYRLVQLLMGGALTAMATAKGHMDRGEFLPAGLALGKAIDRIEGLRVSLDPSVGGELPGRLEQLYEYIKVQLLRANLERNTACLDEAGQLFAPIKDAWDAIEPKESVSLEPAPPTSGETATAVPALRLAV